MQRELTRAADCADPLSASSEPRSSLRTRVVPYFGQRSALARSNFSRATLLARLEAENFALRLRAAELAFDMHLTYRNWPKGWDGAAMRRSTAL